MVAQRQRRRPSCRLAQQAVPPVSWRILLADWAEGGAAAIKMMRIERPAEYVRVMCSILPKELIFDQGMSDFDDDALDELLAGLHQRLLEVREQQALLTAPKEAVTN